jgi:hypothetical protein
MDKINISGNTGKNSELELLFREYEELYQEGLVLINNPDSPEFKENERLRQVNLDRQVELVRVEHIDGG